MLTKAETTEWARRLRSGDYIQLTSKNSETGDSALCRKLKDGGVGHCCLGVKLSETLKYEEMEGEGLPSSIESGLCFASAIEDYEFRLWYPWCHEFRTLRGENAFAHMNDELGYSFARIANVVENLPTKEEAS